MKKSRIVIAFSCALAVAGCKSSSTGPSSPTSLNDGQAPGVGSTYTYHVTEFNPDGSISKESDESTMVTSHEASWNGRQNAVLFDNGGGSAWVYESNGDITSYAGELQDEAFSKQWVLAPFGGGAGVSVIYTDHSPLDYDVVTTKFTGSVADSDSTTVKGTTVTTKHALYTDSTARSTLGTTSYVSTVDYWFAPSIGEMTRIDASNWTDAATGQKHGRTILVLTDYTLNLTDYTLK